MKPRLMLVLVGALFALSSPSHAQSSGQPTKADKARVKKKMGNFDKAFNKAERKILTEDEEAQRRLRLVPGKGKAKGKDRERAKGAKGASDDKAMSPEERAERRKTILEDAKSRRATRKERGEKLKKMHKGTLAGLDANKPAQAAMAKAFGQHARRIARLLRIAEIAAEKKDEKAADRVADLIKKENAFHEANVVRIASQPPKPETETETMADDADKEPTE